MSAKVMTDKVVGVIELAISAGATKGQACDIAGIHRDSLNKYEHDTPGYSDKLAGLKDKPRIQARLNVVNKINTGDLDTSKYYLDRTDKEFRPKSKTELEHTGNKSLIDAILASKKAAKGTE